MQRPRTKTADELATEFENEAKRLMKIANELKAKKKPRGRRAKTGTSKAKRK